MKWQTDGSKVLNAAGEVIGIMISPEAAKEIVDAANEVLQSKKSKRYIAVAGWDCHRVVDTHSNKEVFISHSFVSAKQEADNLNKELENE
jgi:hypothetical protein